MPSLKNAIFTLLGVLGLTMVGLVSWPAPAGATPAPLNNIFLEIDTATTSSTVTLTPSVASQTNGAVNITAGPAGQQFVLTVTAPGNQQLTAGSEYDNQDGANITVNQEDPGRTPLESCGFGPNDLSSVYVDQATYNGSGQPTSLGIEFDVVCASPAAEFSGTAAFNLSPTTPGQGYYIYGDDGSLAGFGNDSYLSYLGDLSTVSLNQPIVGMATTPDGGGYWMAATDGGIFAFGDAGFYGSTGAIHLNQPIVGMAATPDGGGYWLVASDGGIFAFGDAAFYGSTGAIHLNKPIVGMTPTKDGKGYWLVASDGGIFAFGDAVFHGSTGNLVLNMPIVGMAATPDGGGYWMVATDGGIFSFGDAGFHGSTGALHLNEPIVGMTPTSDGQGYWLAAADGGIFTFGDATFDGSLGGLGITNAVGITH
jgi:hypothetical protein